MTRITLLLSLWLIGCAPVRVHDFTFIVREPEGKERAEAAVNVRWILDGLPFDVVLQAGAQHAVRIADTKPHVVEFLLFTGTDDDKSAVGRSGRFLLPGSGEIEPSDRDDPRPIDVPVLLGAPATPERLISDVPTARQDVSACFDSDGSAWVFGGGGGVAGYYFNLDQLSMKDAVSGINGLEGRTACDAFDGQFYLFRGNCGDGGGGDIIQGVIEGDVTNPVSNSVNGCDPVLVVTDEDVWLGVRDLVALYTRDGIASVGRTSAGAVARTGYHAVARGAELFIGGGFNGADKVPGIDVVRRGGTDGLEVEALAEFDDKIIVAMFERNGAPVALDETGVLYPLDGGAPETLFEAGPFTARIRDAVAIPDGRVVALSAVDVESGLASHIALEGNAPQPFPGNATRERLVVTVGGAVLAVGGDAGLDLFVAP